MEVYGTLSHIDELGVLTGEDGTAIPIGARSFFDTAVFGSPHATCAFLVVVGSVSWDRGARQYTRYRHSLLCVVYEMWLPFHFIRPMLV